MTARRPHDKPPSAGADFVDTPIIPTKVELPLRASEAGRMFAFEWDPVSDVVVIRGERAIAFGIDVAAKVTGQQLLSRVHPDDRETLTLALAGLAPGNCCADATFR